MKSDTICAVSTAPGTAGIGIVRISGPGTLGIIARVFRPKRGGDPAARPSHTVRYGHIVENGRAIPELIA